jgi:hypothetical protein
MGKWLDAGDDQRLLHLAWSSAGMTADEASILDGLPRSLADLAGASKDAALRGALQQADVAVSAVLEAWPDALAIGKAAAHALTTLRTTLALTPDAFRHRLTHKATQLARVMFEASGLVVHAAASPAMATPGARIGINVYVHTRDAHLDDTPRLFLSLPEHWFAAPAHLTASGSFLVDIPADAPVSDGYQVRFMPGGGNGQTHLIAAFSIDGVEAAHAIDLEEPLLIAPAVDVVAEPSTAIVNTRRLQSPLRFRVSARPIASGVDSVTIEPETEAGWQFHPPKVELGPAVGDSVADVAVSGDFSPGLYTIRLRVDGQPGLTVRQMGYRHTGPVARSIPATLRIRVLDAAIPTGIRIGYAGGGNDRVDFWLRQLGIDVVPLDAATIVSGDLSQFDTIVVGVFAFGRRPELVSAAARVHAFVREGGNLVTLYHRPWDAWDPHRVPPSYLRIGQPSLRWRVTDETAAVTPLEPQHPLLTRPNVIDAEDWGGWHKERGLYFSAEWDDVYEPLLSMGDPGELPLEGALLSADIGKGRHTHTSLTLHHQMEHLVPGAFRLMANLVTPRETK